jgi:hypothetical protein
MTTGEIFMEMHARELTESMRSFSEAWLARSHNFTSVNWDKPLPAETLIHLRAELLAEGHPDLAAKMLLVLLGEHTASSPQPPKPQLPATAAFFSGQPK